MLEARYCHAPWPMVAALSTIATPASVLADDPPVTKSIESLKLPAKSVLTGDPAAEFPMSSLTAASVALPLATGASFTAFTVRLTVSVAVENEVVPPVLEMLAVPPLLPPLIESQARTVRAVARVPLRLEAGCRYRRVSESAANNRAVVALAVNEVHVTPLSVE